MWWAARSSPPVLEEAMMAEQHTMEMQQILREQKRPLSYATSLASAFLLAFILSAGLTSATTYLWVPKFDSSSVCTEAGLSEGAQFGGTANWTTNVMVTDEFSQVFMGVAKANNQTRMEWAFNTINNITSFNYRPLPEWKVRRDGGTFNMSIVVNNDTASDGDARLILGLIIASNNTNFNAANRSVWRTTAQSWCKAFVSYDFVFNETGFTTPVSNAKLKWFAATGADSATSGITSDGFMHGGYTGDNLQALLACASINASAQVFNQTTATYLAIAQNITDGYLAAVRFNGASLSFIGDKYKWTNASGGTTLVGNALVNATCTENCNPMDYDDATRITSICEAQYFANFTLGGAANPLGANLTSYCNLWQNATFNPGITDIAYVPQYYLNGSSYQGLQEGFFENGLGGRLNFWQNQSNMTTRIAKLAEKVDTANSGIYGSSCFGVYRHSQGVQFWGDAIGLSNAAFGGAYLSGIVNPGATGFSSQNYTQNFYTLVGYWFNKTSAQQNATQFISDAAAADTTAPGITYGGNSDSGTLTRSNIVLNATATDDVSVANITGFLYNSTGLVNQTTQSGANLFLNFTGLADGTYYVNATAFDTSTNQNSTTTRTILITTTGPVVVIISPGSDSSFNSLNVLFNHTAADPNGVSGCWYSFNGGITNTSVTCNSSSTIRAGEGTNILFLYANDTLGGFGSASVTFSAINVCTSSNNTIFSLIMIASGIAICGFVLFYIRREGMETLMETRTIIVITAGVLIALTFWLSAAQNLGSACPIT